MARTEAENKKAGWLQRKLRLRLADSANLDSVADSLGLNMSDAVARLCREWLDERGVRHSSFVDKAVHHIDGNPRNNKPSNLRMVKIREGKR